MAKINGGSGLYHLHLDAERGGEFEGLDDLVPNPRQEDLLLAGQDLHLLVAGVLELPLELEAHLREFPT